MRGFLRIGGVLALLVFVGALGFMALEGWDFFDALYMAVITITTVGYSEVHPLSIGGRVFVLLYLIAGVGVFMYSVAQLGDLIVQSQLRGWLGRRRMDNELKSIENHYIVCGYGRMGRTLCSQLASRRLPFVVVERDEQAVAECRAQGWPWLVGDATEESVLVDAGLHRARGLAAVLPSDADNLYIVLTARLLAPELSIVSRASDDKAVAKMEKAGANHVVSVYRTGARRMALLLHNPQLDDFMSIFTDRRSEVDMVQIYVDADAPYAGLGLGQTDFRERGIMIVAIRRADGELVLPPPSTMRIAAGDSLIVVGKEESIAALLDAEGKGSGGPGVRGQKLPQP